jgi:hypothetical protein|tara:strand:- start:163 stop:489 length:327 start_codon:yes stop_codon:yes gene_type:complete
MKHYYDPGLDDCPKHEDSEVEYLYELRITFPIGYSFDHPGWKAADNTAKKFINNFGKFMDEKNLKKDEIILEAHLTHVGREDKKMCGKMIRQYPDKKGFKELMKRWLE